MTVLVGILCQDGVVIGSDSAITFSVTSAVSHFHTLEHGGAIKVDLVGDQILTATTGSVGLAQRYLSTLRSLHASNGIDLTSDPVQVATFIANNMIREFSRTLTHLQQQKGWEIGALLALPIRETPSLFEFDPTNFHPEQKGDVTHEGKMRTPPIVTMGSGQLLADPFLAFVSRLFWQAGERPRLADAKLAVAWTLQHAIEFNPGGIGGTPQIGILEKRGDEWEAGMLDVGEVLGQVRELEAHIRGYRTAFMQNVSAGEVQLPQKEQAAPVVAT